MTIDDSLREFIQSKLPVNPAYRLQYGAWKSGVAADKFVVIRPIGGAPISLIRDPIYSIVFIGAVDQSATELKVVADSIRLAVLTDYKRGDIVNMTASEPAFFQTDDGRPVYELTLNLTVTL